MRSNGGHLIFTSITGNGDMGITGMQSGAARRRRRWIVNPVYAASEPGLGNNSFNNFCFKSLSCDIFIFTIVIPVRVSDISFIYLFYIIAVLCESKYFVMHIFSLFYLFT